MAIGTEAPALLGKFRLNVHNNLSTGESACVVGTKLRMEGLIAAYP
jgi:hypothetical protein